MLILHFHHIIECTRNGFDIFSEIAVLLNFYFKSYFVNINIVVLYFNHLSHFSPKNENSDWSKSDQLETKWTMK